MTERVLVIGARSQIGAALLPQLIASGYSVTAVSRKHGHVKDINAASGVRWSWLGESLRDTQPAVQSVETLINIAPLWTFVKYLPHVAALGVKRLISFSSTSIFTKVHSKHGAERQMVQRLKGAESELIEYCTLHGIAWNILRPTLVYGDLQHQNIRAVGAGLAPIARWVRHTSMFPIVGGHGLRQPVHVGDLAAACTTLLRSPANSARRSYNLSGAETLTYRAMVRRIGERLGRPVVMVPVPSALLRTGLRLLAKHPRYKFLTAEMANRMNVDLVFDHSDATHAFGFAPRPFLAATKSGPCVA